MAVMAVNSYYLMLTVIANICLQQLERSQGKLTTPACSLNETTFTISNVTLSYNNSLENSVCPFLRCDEEKQGWVCSGRKDEVKYCACDSQCHLFQDCCEDNFNSEIYFHSYNYDSMMDFNETDYEYMMKVFKYSSCISIKFQRPSTSEIKIISIRVINQCPSHYTGLLRTKCSSNYQILNILTSVRVGIHDLVFRNPYCALCHGYNVKDLQLWDTSVLCPETYKGIPKTDIQKLSKYCELVHTFKENQNFRYCVHPFISEKFLSVDQREETIDDILCFGYISPLTNENKNISFRNKNCAIASRYNLSLLQPFTEMRNIQLISSIMDMNILFRFTGNGFDNRNPSKCASNLTYDPITGLCASLICPDGFVKRGQSCIYDDSNYEFIYQPSLTDTFENNSLTYFYLRKKNFLEGSQWTCVISDDGEYVFDYVTKCLNLIFLEMNFSSEVFQLQNFPPNESLICKTGGLETLRADELLETKDDFFRILYNQKTIQIPFGKIRFSITAEILKTDAMVMIKGFSNVTFFFCTYISILKCPTFLTSYKVNEYTLINNSVHFNLSSVVLMSGQYKIINSILYICHKENPYSDDNVLNLILTTVFFSISLFCLLLAMFLQINVRGIQTCPAKCFLSFSLSWFIAQFSFILPPFLPSRVCLTFAMLLHYLWLCIFSWSSILSFDLVKSLNACSKILKREFENNSLFVKYCIAGWGLPLFIVGLSNVLEISLSTFTLQYGARNICWIGNSDALLLAYILPASTFLFFNMICLAVSLHGLEIAKRNSRNLQKTRKDRQRWLMYLQMFFLCGGCWIFAYLANNVSLLWMHILNLILNGSQGVFILIMTTRDSKVKRWIRIQIKCLEPDNSNGSQSNSGVGTVSTKL